MHHPRVRVAVERIPRSLFEVLEEIAVLAQFISLIVCLGESRHAEIDLVFGCKTFHLFVRGAGVYPQSSVYTLDDTARQRERRSDLILRQQHQRSLVMLERLADEQSTISVRLSCML